VKLQGRVALVFGGSSGIGRGCTEALAEEGASVVVADPNETGGNEVVEAVRAGGGTATFLSSDVADEASVQRAVAYTVETYGKLDILVNSAGAPTRKDWHRGIDIFLKGPYYACRHALPELERNGGGAIVNIGSIASIRGSANAGDIDGTAYPMAKHGIIGLTKTLALSYGDKNIRVNAICPGFIKTGLTKKLYEAPDADAYVTDTLRVPLGRWGEPEDIGRVAAFLASDDAGYISGQAIVVDGGMTAR
jgi:NAD(P)-dependent dehydrogenase (short-subunit alcohol dehydrogenase family)